MEQFHATRNPRNLMQVALAAATFATAYAAMTPAPALAVEQTVGSGKAVNDTVAPTLQVFMQDGKRSGALIDTALNLPPDVHEPARGCDGTLYPDWVAEYDKIYPMLDFTDPLTQEASYFFFDGGGATPVHRFKVRARDLSGIKTIRVRIVTRDFVGSLSYPKAPGVTPHWVERDVEYVQVSEPDAHSSVLPIYQSGGNYLHDETVLTWTPPPHNRINAWRPITFEVHGWLGVAGRLMVDAEDNKGNVSSDRVPLIWDYLCN